jgi:hypothetical protein
MFQIACHLDKKDIQLLCMDKSGDFQECVKRCKMEGSGEVASNQGLDNGYSKRSTCVHKVMMIMSVFSITNLNHIFS